MISQSESLSKNEESQSDKNIAVWKKANSLRYTIGDRNKWANCVASQYRWIGTFNANYQRSKGEIHKIFESADALRIALPDIRVTSQMFGEGKLLANLFTIEGTHQCEYRGVAASNRPVKVFGISIARFDDHHQILEERELWDELSFLRQIGYIDNDGDIDLLSIMEKVKGGEIIKRHPVAFVPSARDVQCDIEAAIPIERDVVVQRNISNWHRFFEIKYVTHQFDRIDAVMSPEWHWHGPAGMAVDISQPGGRQAMFQGQRDIVENIPDLQFTKQLFGQGNFIHYSVACEYTHSTDVFGVAGTGRRICHANMAVCRCDDLGRVAEEWEMIDLLALLVQAGVVPDNDQSLTWLDVLKNI